MSTGEARLVSPAPLPESPLSPKPIRSGVLAAVAGLLVGLVLAAVREHLDDSIKTRADVGEALGGVPVLAAIPMAPARRSAGEPGLIVMSPEATPASESFRALRTSVQLLGVEHRLRTIQVTSPNEGEGKTTVVGNLAAVMAQAGERAVVVDCDLRKPTCPFGPRRRTVARDHLHPVRTGHPPRGSSASASAKTRSPFSVPAPSLRTHRNC